MDKAMAIIDKEIDSCAQDIRDIKNFMKWCSAPVFTSEIEIKLGIKQGRLKELLKEKVLFGRARDPNREKDVEIIKAPCKSG